MGQLLERGREAATPSTSSPGPPSASPPSSPSTGSAGKALHQDLQKLRVEVEGLQTTRDWQVVVYLSYLNKTKEELIIGLDNGPTKTFVVDNAGNQFAYKQGSGLSGGLYSNENNIWLDYSSFLTLAPGEKGSASFTFAATQKGEKLGTMFHFTSGQFFVKFSGEQKQVKQSYNGFNISIRNIEPR